MDNYKLVKIQLYGDARTAITGGYRYTFNIPASLQGQIYQVGRIEVCASGFKGQTPKRIPAETRDSAGVMICNLYDYDYGSINNIVLLDAVQRMTGNSVSIDIKDAEGRAGIDLGSDANLVCASQFFFVITAYVKELQTINIGTSPLKTDETGGKKFS